MQHVVPTPEEVTLGGRRLLVAALTDRQHVELDQWVRAQMIRAASEALPPDDPGWDRVVATVARESLQVTWLNSQASRSRSGYAQVVLKSCVAGAPGLDEWQVRRLLAAATDLEAKRFNEVYMRLNYPVKREAKPDDPGPPAPA